MQKRAYLDLMSMANRFSQQGQGAQGGSWASGEQRIGDMARRSVEEKNNNATSELQKQIAQLKGVRIAAAVPHHATRIASCLEHNF